MAHSIPSQQTPNLNHWLRLVCATPFDSAAEDILLWLGSNSQTAFGQTSGARQLWETLRQGEGPAAAIEALIACGANPTGAMAPTDPSSALDAAIQAGRADCVKALLPWVPPELNRVVGCNALICAARTPAPECLRVLLGRFDPLLADKTGSTALMHAVAVGSLECVRLLAPVSNCAAVNVFGWSAFASAASHGHLNIVDFLCALCDPDQADSEGATPLMIAALNGHDSVVAFLLPRCDPLAKAPKGEDAFECAVGEEHWACADLFSSLISLDRVKAALAAAPLNEMPASRAAIERLELAAVVSENARGDAQGDPLSESLGSRRREARRV